MKFTYLLTILLAFAPSAHAESLKISVHHHDCVDSSLEKVQRAVSDYDSYPCNPSAKLKLSKEILIAAGVPDSLIPTGGWGIQIASLTYAGSWDAKAAPSAPVPSSLPKEMRNRWVWLQFQPLNLGCNTDTPECRELALLYPRLLLYCAPTVSADGAKISNHCKLASRKINGIAPPPLLDNFGVEAYDGMTVVAKNDARCQPGQTSVDIDILASMKREDLNAAIDRSNLSSIWKTIIERPLLETKAYNDYFEAFNEGFVSELKSPQTCAVTPPPAAEIPRP